MSESIKIALISAGSALFGGLIGVIGTITVNRQNINGERKNKQIELKTQCYIEFINSMQTFMNEGTSEGFYKFQKAINKILIIANKETAKNVHDYYKKLIENAKSRNMTEEEHSNFQTKIINSIREDLDVSQDELNNVYLVQYIGRN